MVVLIMRDEDGEVKSRLARPVLAGQATWSLVLWYLRDFCNFVCNPLSHPTEAPELPIETREPDVRDNE